MLSDGAFRYTVEGDVPSMALEDIWAHIRVMDPRTYWELFNDMSDLQKTQRQTVLKELRAYNPILFQTLEAIVRAYQNAHFVAAEVRTQYFALYHHFVTARLRCENVNDQRFEDLILEEKELPEKKKRARDELEDSEKENLKISQETRRLLKESKSEQLFYAQENFTNAFSLPDYRHVVPKGRKAWSIQRVQDYGCWKTIYHCNGPWEAEMWTQELLNKGEFAIIIKKRRGPDIDVTGYKVLHGDFTP